MEDVKEPTSDEQQALELGIMLGQRRAFAMIAGRCTAAQAECLRKIRDGKMYLKYALTWGEYCVRVLKISKRTADYTIALLKKHGTLYFETAALTGISPAGFGRIQHSIQKDGIHIGGEVIALIPENAERAVEAVARLQAEADAEDAAQPAASVEKQLADLEKRGRQMCDSFHQIAGSANGFERSWVIGSIEKVRALVNRLALEIR
jgi:hypothetical protein